MTRTANGGGKAELGPALPGESFELDDIRMGRIHVYVDGPEDSPEPPLLLVHSVNAAASAIETLPIYDHGRATRRTYALDLPGYGLSERSERRYSPRLMTDAVLAVADEMRRRHGGAAVDGVALSLACEFLARAANERPDAFRSLALVSPTGFEKRELRHGPEGSHRGISWVHGALASNLWSDGLFRNLTRPGVVRYFLERTWGGKEIDERVWAYAVATAQQPGAKNAPLWFLSAHLFSADSGRLYENLTMPVWMCHGVRGDFVTYHGVAAVEKKPNWTITVFETGALPQFEIPEQFDATYDGFLAAAAAAVAALRV